MNETNETTDQIEKLKDILMDYNYTLKKIISRAKELNEKIKRSQDHLKKIRDLGLIDHPCYAHAHEESRIEAYKDEIEFLETLL
jgi:hypothetical protein